MQKNEYKINFNEMILHDIRSIIELVNSIIGPHVSLGAGTKVSNSIVRNSIVQAAAQIKLANISDSMLGTGAEVTGKAADLSISDYSQIIV